MSGTTTNNQACSLVGWDDLKTFRAMTESKCSQVCANRHDCIATSYGYTGDVNQRCTICTSGTQTASLSNYRYREKSVLGQFSSGITITKTGGSNSIRENLFTDSNDNNFRTFSGTASSSHDSPTAFAEVFMPEHGVYHNQGNGYWFNDAYGMPEMDRYGVTPSHVRTGWNDTSIDAGFNTNYSNEGGHKAMPGMDHVYFYGRGELESRSEQFTYSASSYAKNPFVNNYNQITFPTPTVVTSIIIQSHYPNDSVRNNYWLNWGNMSAGAMTQRSSHYYGAGPGTFDTPNNDFWKPPGGGGGGWFLIYGGMDDRMNTQAPLHYHRGGAKSYYNNECLVGWGNNYHSNLQNDEGGFVHCGIQMFGIHVYKGAQRSRHITQMYDYFSGSYFAKGQYTIMFDIKLTGWYTSSDGTNISDWIVPGNMPTIVNTFGVSGNNSDDFPNSDVWDSTFGAIRIYQSFDNIVTIVRGGHGTRFSQVYQNGSWTSWRTSEGKFHGGGQAYEIKYQWKKETGSTQDLFKDGPGGNFTTTKVVFQIDMITQELKLFVEAEELIPATFPQTKVVIDKDPGDVRTATSNQDANWATAWQAMRNNNGFGTGRHGNENVLHNWENYRSYRDTRYDHCMTMFSRHWTNSLSSQVESMDYIRIFDRIVDAKEWTKDDAECLFETGKTSSYVVHSLLHDGKGQRMGSTTGTTYPISNPQAFKTLTFMSATLDLSGANQASARIARIIINGKPYVPCEQGDAGAIDCRDGATPHDFNGSGVEVNMYNLIGLDPSLKITNFSEFNVPDELDFVFDFQEQWYRAFVGVNHSGVDEHDDSNDVGSGRTENGIGDINMNVCSGTSFGCGRDDECAAAVAQGLSTSSTCNRTSTNSPPGDPFAFGAGMLCWSMGGGSAWRYTTGNAYHCMTNYSNGGSMEQMYGWLGVQFRMVTTSLTSRSEAESTSGDHTSTGRGHYALGVGHPLNPLKGEIRMADNVSSHHYAESWQFHPFWNGHPLIYKFSEYNSRVKKSTYNQTSDTGASNWISIGPNNSSNSAAVRGCMNVRKLLDNQGNETHVTSNGANQSAFGNLVRTSPGFKIETRNAQIRYNSFVFKAWNPSHFIDTSKNFNITFETQIEGVGHDNYGGDGKHIFDVCGGKVLAQFATESVSFASLGIALRGRWTDVDHPNDDEHGGVYLHVDTTNEIGSENSQYIPLAVGADPDGNFIETWDPDGDSGTSGNKWPSQGTHPNENKGAIFKITLTYNAIAKELSGDVLIMEAKTCVYGEEYNSNVHPNWMESEFGTSDNKTNVMYKTDFKVSYQMPTFTIPTVNSGPLDQVGGAKLQYLLIGNRPKKLWVNDNNYYTDQRVRKMSFVSWD